MISAISRPQMSGSLPPVAPQPRAAERFFLGHDHDNWFVIPVRCRRAWESYLNSPPSRRLTPNYARAISSPLAITFTDVKDNS
jgi:hypothetical protein